MPKNEKKTQKDTKAETTPKLNGAVAAQAALFHLQRSQYHKAEGRPEVAQQHESRYIEMRNALNGARRRVIDGVVPYLRGYDGPEVTEYVEYEVPKPVEGVTVNTDLPQEAKDTLAAIAADQGKSLRGLIREILVQAVATLQPPQEQPEEEAPKAKKRA